MHEYLVEGWMNGSKRATRVYAYSEIEARRRAKEELGESFNPSNVKRL